MKTTLNIKIGLVSLAILIASIGIYMRLVYQPPADPNADRVAVRLTSSFPGPLGIFINTNIYVKNIDKPGLTRVTNQTFIEDMPDWDPSGEKIVYVHRIGMSISNADGTGQPELVWQSKGDGTTLNPAWSPDGNKIAFTSGSLYILDLTTKQVTLLFNDNTRGRQPDWSPDGNQIVFTLLTATATSLANSSIAIANSDGSGLQQLTPENGSKSPKWSPDGSTILFNLDGQIYTMNVNGTEIKALTSTGRNIDPTWSSDGKNIAFVSLPDDRCHEFIQYFFEFCSSELLMMDADGSNIVTIMSSSSENIGAPDWSPVP